MMRRRQVLVFLAVAAAVCGAGALMVPAAAGAWTVPAARGAVPSAGSWGRAIEVPGLGALNKGASGDVVVGVNSVSCGAPGNCAAVGDYRDRRHHFQGFVAVERHGVWHGAIEVPGLGALNKGGHADVNWVSCTSARDCAAGGGYTDRRGHGQGFVAAERHGRWVKAIEVPGLGALNKGGDAYVGSVSCASAGNCAAGGLYTGRDRGQQGFVAVEKNGVWRRAIEVPGLGALNKDGDAEVLSVSCASAGSCAAGGHYNWPDDSQGFVAAEKNGRWGRAIEVPGLGALNKGHSADVFSVSCASAGSCAAGGDYTDGGSSGQGFVAAERNGRWGTAMNVPGLRALNQGAGAEVDSVSCASAGNCAAVGTYRYPYTAGFEAVEKNGVWGTAIDAGLTGRIAGVSSVSCASPGNCAAGGFYSDDIGGIDQGFVAAGRHGRWGKPIEVPGLGALNQGGYAGVSSVSCARAGSCAAGGSYTDRRQHFQGFVVSQTG